MAKHLMVDMETLAVSPRTVILSLGAVHFNPFGDEIYDTLYFKIDLDDQDKLRREIDPGTIDWWSKQDPSIMEEAFSPDNRIPLAEAVDKFHKFAWGCDKFWSHGSTFDLVILEDLYKQLNRVLPWRYWQLRDTRTLFDLGFDPDMSKDNKHDALADAVRQARGVQAVFRKLNNLIIENENH
jgi:hypothetical protein